MDGGSMFAARSLPVDAALISEVLLRLRRDTPGSTARWALGAHGSAEIDVNFFPDASATDLPAWTSTARLWDPEAVAMARSVVVVSAETADTCTLTVRPDLPLAPWWSARQEALLDLARAALDELAEELLWHATRHGVSTPDSW